MSYKLIVAGGRDFTDYDAVVKTLNHMHEQELIPDETLLEFVCGKARGADAVGEQVARDHGCVVHEFPADWDTHGKRAGFLRNTQMGDFADGLLAFWDGKSKGTKHMIDYMVRIGKPLYVVRY